MRDEDCTDGELAALVLAGRKAAFAEIMRRHKEPLYRLILGHVGSPDDALDLVQESFVAAYRNLESYDPERPLRAWLARIAINKCRDWARRRNVRRFFSFARPLDDAAAVADPAPPPDAAAADREALDALWAAIAALPRSLKEPLLLCAVDGLSQAEAATVLRISPKAVETRLYRARAKLAAHRPGASRSSGDD
ncbi:MAG: RNA polymerase sigma factor [Sphingomonas sp.]|nr:RNA polymerase sigma factor [Sphingomonas sp.]